MFETDWQVLDYLAVVQGAAAIWMSSLVVAGVRRIRFLRDVTIVSADAASLDWPKLSIVLAARNEAGEIGNCLASLLNQNYPDFEIIAVNDRSIDDTGRILDEFSQRNDRLQVIHVRELPADWLGKNHALQRGADLATGEYILFTDADVIMHPETMRCGVKYLTDHGLDHLTAMPEMRLPGWLAESVLGIMTQFFMLRIRPWRNDPARVDRFVGIGAFNLVKTTAYQMIGMHQTIRMCPLDDIKLGKKLKQAGFRQGLVFGTGMIEVKWYPSLKEMFCGLEKNTFALFDFEVRQVVLFLWVLATVFGTPLIGCLVSSGIGWWFFATSLIAILAATWQVHAALGLSRWAVPLHQLGVALVFVLVTRNIWLTLWRGGITWRDTFYSLDRIRALDC